MSRQQKRAETRKRERDAALRAARVLLAKGDGGGNRMWVESSVEIDVLAAGDDGKEPGPPTFNIVAYSGGYMRPRGFGHRVVANLRKMKVYAGSIPVHVYHDQQRPVGHGEVTIDSTVRVAGALTVAGPDAAMVAESGRNKFPWKASVGLSLDKPLKFYAAGEKFEANGRKFTGPAYYADESTLFEVSFVTVAGDPTTRVDLAATRGHHGGVLTMTFEQWLEANGFSADDLTDGQKTLLRASYEAEQGDDEDDAPVVKKTKIKASGGRTIDPEALGLPSIADFKRELRATFKEELKSQARFSELRAQYGDVTIEVGGKQVDLYAHAAQEEWSSDKLELEAMRYSRQSAPAIHTHEPALAGADSREVLEAAAATSMGVMDEKQLLATYGEQILEKAKKLDNLGLQETAIHACAIEGVKVPTRWRNNEREIIRAAFTTLTLPSVFENVMNKSLTGMMAQFTSYARKVCRVGSASDFKPNVRVDLFGTGAWKRVGADGELKEGALSDTKYTSQVETFGQYMVLSRQDWKNDDLGALNRMSQLMAFMGNYVIEDLFFTILLGNPNNFLHSGNANVGAGVAFGAAGLSALKTIFRKKKQGPSRGGTKKAEDQVPINIDPAQLWVPVELEDAAFTLIGSPNNIATANGEKNPHFGKYRIESPPQLSDTRYTGNSATGYYLFADPIFQAAFVLSFLDGIQRPTIEAEPVGGRHLGMGFRGWIDVGVDQEDPKFVAFDDGTP
jgi:hypothetical protein